MRLGSLQLAPAASSRPESRHQDQKGHPAVATPSRTAAGQSRIDQRSSSHTDLVLRRSGHSQPRCHCSARPSGHRRHGRSLPEGGLLAHLRTPAARKTAERLSHPRAQAIADAASKETSDLCCCVSRGPRELRLPHDRSSQAGESAWLSGDLVTVCANMALSEPPIEPASCRGGPGREFNPTVCRQPARPRGQGQPLPPGAASSGQGSGSEFQGFHAPWSSRPLRRSASTAAWNNCPLVSKTARSGGPR